MVRCFFTAPAVGGVVWLCRLLGGMLLQQGLFCCIERISPSGNELQRQVVITIPSVLSASIISRCRRGLMGCWAFVTVLQQQWAW